MNRNMRENIQRTKNALEPIGQSVIDHCKDGHKRYLEREKQRRDAETALKIQAQQDEIQQELAVVLSNFSYPKLKQIYSLADLRQAGWIIKKGRIIYFFTVDKTDWEKIPIAILEIIKQNMNKDIIAYSKELAKYYAMQEIYFMYPALYYGTWVIHVQDQQTYVRLAVITNMPL